MNLIERAIAKLSRRQEDDPTLAERMERADRAARELQATSDAFAYIGAEILFQWSSTHLKDTELREKLWAQYHALASLETRLVATVADGDLARDELQRSKD